MSIWKKIKSWATQNADHYLYVYFPTADGQPMRPNRDYFRLWLNQMYITKSRKWFTEWYPAVHSSVSLKFGDGDDTVTLSRVAQGPDKVLAKAVLRDFTLTELLPFRGGVVEIEAALLALKGKDYLGSAIKVLESFSGLVGAPLGQALNVAKNVSGGIDELVGAKEDNQVHLGFHQELAAEGGDLTNVLNPGHIAVILATGQELDKRRLSIKEGQLYYRKNANAEPQELTGYDYMLFYMERREERDDWRLSTIQAPLNQAIEAVLKGKEDEAKAFRQAALIAAYQSEDLTVYDRRRVVQAIKDELAEIGDQGLGAVGNEVRDLGAILEDRIMPLEDAEALGELSFEEATADE